MSKFNIDDTARAIDEGLGILPGEQGSVGMSGIGVLAFLSNYVCSLDVDSPLRGGRAELSYPSSSR